jgi:hypothetical protein
MINRLVYKVVRAVEDELWSLTDTAYSVRYRLGENVESVYPLFVFNSLGDAIRFDKKNRVYVGIATNVRVIHAIQTDTISPRRSSKIETFWLHYPHYCPDRRRLSYSTPPIGTLICDSIQLIKRLN